MNSIHNNVDDIRGQIWYPSIAVLSIESATSSYN
jgi:hypothetical protein